MITGLDHINLTIASETLQPAYDFYAGTLGLIPAPVPETLQGVFAWFKIGNSGQQVHIGFGCPSDFANKSTRHACFKLPSPEKLDELQWKIFKHFEQGGEAAPGEVDMPGKGERDGQWQDAPGRFFARDFAGNRLEFTL